jgi:hypothetical protein
MTDDQRSEHLKETIKRTLPLISRLHTITLGARLMRGDLLPNEAVLARYLLHYRKWKQTEGNTEEIA